ncbi:MAG: TIGR02300 family protein [Rhodobacteraceae bacterium]|nr:TIGR02300 family protein [Paracoccaceae bacterium]
MPKEEWGVKRLCPTTGRRFYDLNRTPIVSPYTGETVDLDASRRRGPLPPPRVIPDKAEKELVDVLETDEDLLVGEPADETEIDDELLEADEDETVSLDDLPGVGGEDEE